MLALTMPSLSLLMPWSKTLSLALSSADGMSLSSGGPSRRRRSSETASAAADVVLIANRWRTAMAPALSRLAGEVRSLLERYLPVGERLLTTRLVGLASRPWSSLNLAWLIRLAEDVLEDRLEDNREAAPRLWADWSFRSWRWVRGEGGACNSVARLGA